MSVLGVYSVASNVKPGGRVPTRRLPFKAVIRACTRVYAGLELHHRQRARIPHNCSHTRLAQVSRTRCRHGRPFPETRVPAVPLARCAPVPRPPRSLPPRLSSPPQSCRRGGTRPCRSYRSYMVMFMHGHVHAWWSASARVRTRTCQCVDLRVRSLKLGRKRVGKSTRAREIATTPMRLHGSGERGTWRRTDRPRAVAAAGVHVSQPASQTPSSAPASSARCHLPWKTHTVPHTGVAARRKIGAQWWIRAHRNDGGLPRLAPRKGRGGCLGKAGVAASTTGRTCEPGALDANALRAWKDPAAAVGRAGTDLAAPCGNRTATRPTREPGASQLPAAILGRARGARQRPGRGAGQRPRRPARLLRTRAARAWRLTHRTVDPISRFHSPLAPSRCIVRI